MIKIISNDITVNIVALLLKSCSGTSLSLLSKRRNLKWFFDDHFSNLGASWRRDAHQQLLLLLGMSLYIYAFNSLEGIKVDKIFCFEQIGLAFTVGIENAPGEDGYPC